MPDKTYKLSFEMSDGSTKDLRFTVPQGDPGKTAYQYAQEGGYTGTEAEFAKKLTEKMPTALPNPYPLTINGKIYDGSEEVNVVVTGGAASDAVSLGQTPVTLPQTANIRLVGEGEHSYTIKGKTVADISTATIAKNYVAMTEHEDHIELTVSGSPANWYNAFAALTFSGLTVGESYAFCIESFGIDTANLTFNGYFLIKNASGSELGRIEGEPAGLVSVTFIASTETVVVQWYPANNYYWGQGYRTALVGDIYINKASDGTDRTGVINESGTFTDSYSLGQLQKGITITAEPSCEVYSVSGGGGSGGASAPLAGKTVVCSGDSLFGMYTGDTSAPAYAAQKTGATVYNVGFSGCRMSKHPYTSHNPFCMYALADAIASGDWTEQDANAANGSANFPDQLAILKGIDFNTVDYIVIHYGTNDFAAGGSGVEIDNPDNPKATNTLCGALRHSVETLLGAFPKLKIFVSLPAFRYWTAEDGTVTDSDEKTNVNGHTLPDFVKALAETAREYKLPVIDCYYGLGINKSNAGTFLADGTHHNVEGRKRFGEYIGAKLISEGDTFQGANSETGGSASIDVTAAVGQTIVVEEVDASGKPTKWKAVDYQEKICGSEEIVVMEETTIVPSDDGTMMFAPLAVPSVGDVCKVTYNGTEYTCEAVDGSAMSGMPGTVMLGNIDLAMGTGDTGEPFVAVIVMAGEGGGQLLPLDSSETFTLSIKGKVVTKIPKKYIPSLSDEFAIHFVGDLSEDVGTDGAVRVVETAEAIYEALSNKKTLVGYLNTTKNGSDIACVMHDYTIATTQSEGNDVFVITFGIWQEYFNSRIHKIHITVGYLDGVPVCAVETNTGEVLN